MFLEIGYHFVPFAIKFHRAVQHKPEGVLAGVRVKVILAAALNNLRVHPHEIAAAHQQRFFNAVKFRRRVFENLRFLFHGPSCLY